MSARYQVLQHEQKPYWLPDCPLLMASHALTKDTTNNTVFLQCKFENLSDKRIKALSIRVECYDVTNQPLVAVDNFTYLDINIANAKSFGDQTPVSLPDRETRAFHVIPQKIVFVDNSIWENADNQPFVLAEYEQKRISSLGDLTDQYKRDLHDICSKSNTHTYLPARKDGFTICGCGKIVLDSTKTCPACGVMIDRLFALNNSKQLKENLEAYNATQQKIQQQRQQFAQEQQAQQQQAKAQQRSLLKRIFICGVSIAVIITIYISATKYFIPNMHYQSALKAWNNGEFEDAISQLEQIPSFKDSSSKISEIEYSWAEQLYHNGEYEQAIQKYSELGDYKDASAQIHAIRNLQSYNEALALYNNQQYEEALPKFRFCGDYKDAVSLKNMCETKLQEQHYNRALDALNAQDSSTALKEFLSAVPYKDSIAQARKIGEFSRRIESCLSSGVVISKSGKFQKLLPNDDKYDTYVNWSSIKKLVAGTYQTVGLNNDGTTIAIGSYNDEGSSNVSSWSNIIDIEAGCFNTFGLKSNGTVVAVGSNDHGECNVGSWNNIIAISNCINHTVGLRSDGTVVATGDNSDGQCNVSSWSNIIMVGAGNGFTVGLKADGTVVATGWNDFGQCDISDWNNIISIAVHGDHTIGIKSDGTAVATGILGGSISEKCDVSNWESIVATDGLHGVKADGSLIYADGKSTDWSSIDWDLW